MTPQSTVLIGDVRARIKDILDGSIDFVCTSPPFLALRKYGDNHEDEMGSERTPAEFIDGLLSLTAEFRRILAPHGSIAVELGDTFSGSGGAGGDYNADGLRAGQAKFDGSAKRRTRTNNLYTSGYSDGRHGNETKKPGEMAYNGGRGWPLAKSLCLTPFAYPMALAYGRNPLTGQPSPAGQWMVRNMIAWARPNPPVGELADKVRPGTSYITVATTSPRRWFDLDAVRGPHSVPNGGPMRGRAAASRIDGGDVKDWASGERFNLNPIGAPPLDWWDDDYDPADPVDAYTLGHMTLVQATQPYKGAHYATWPKALAQRLILMMCPPKVCTVCGKPSARVTTLGWTECGCGDGCRPTTWKTLMEPVFRLNEEGDEEQVCKADGTPKMRKRKVLDDLGDCADPSHWRNGVVLDPFAGSGTTLLMANVHGRDAVGIELYPSNANLIIERFSKHEDGRHSSGLHVPDLAPMIEEGWEW